MSIKPRKKPPGKKPAKFARKKVLGASVAQPMKTAKTPALPRKTPPAGTGGKLPGAGGKPKHHPMMAKVHGRAKVPLKKKVGERTLKSGDGHSEAEWRVMFHDLQVHQVKLEMQNQDLQVDRNRAEGLLEKYSDLYDFAPVGYFNLTAEGTILMANLTGTHLAGINRSRLINQKFEKVITKEFRSEFRSLLRQAFAGTAKQTANYEILCKGQTPLPVYIEAQRSPNGLECRVMVMDIRDRKQAEKNMTASEIRYRRLFEAAHDGVLLLDPATRKITDANPFMTRLLGYSHDQLVGKELFEIGLLKDEAASKEMFQKLKRKGEVRYEDLPLKSQKGCHQEVEVVANLYPENGSNVIQCNIRDITERKLAEDILRRNEVLFSSLIEQAPLGVYVVDAQFRLQQVNRRARPVFGKIHPLIGRDFAEINLLLWPKRASDKVTKQFRRTLKTGESYQSLFFCEPRQDTGRVEIFEWQVQRVTLPAGEFGLVVFFNDITEKKRSEEAQRQLDILTASTQKLEKEIVQRKAVEKSLKKSEKNLNSLLDQSRHLQEQLQHLSRGVLRIQEAERKRISRELHDVIAQTLAGINIRLANLKKESSLGTDHIERQVAGTQRQVKKSIGIVQEFARELRPAVLDDLGLIPALHTFMKQFTARTGIRTHLTAFTGVERLKSPQRTVLFRVAQESLINVSRHAKASRVEVTIQKLPGGIGMQVSDNGKSFSVKDVLHRKGSQRLGLLGMKERLEMVGGQFEVDSIPGKGTTIKAKIPLKLSKASPPNEQ
jgi:PAS domain S-box-containing protein